MSLVLPGQSERMAVVVGLMTDLDGRLNIKSHRLLTLHMMGHTQGIAGAGYNRIICYPPTHSLQNDPVCLRSADLCTLNWLRLRAISNKNKTSKVAVHWRGTTHTAVD